MQHSNSDLVMVLVLCLILLWNQVVPGDFCEQLLVLELVPDASCACACAFYAYVTMAPVLVPLLPALVPMLVVEEQELELVLAL